MSERFLKVLTIADGVQMIEALTKALETLPARDHNFTNSLLANYRKNERKLDVMQRLSGAQWYWVAELTRRAQPKDEPVRETVDVGVKGVIRLFETAKQHLKKPAIVLAVDNQHDLIRLKPAAETGRAPGTINVIRVEDAVWLGRIHKDGRFELSGKVAKSEATAVLPALKAFAADPATGAKKSALLTGRCCFCHTPLRDERSTDVGYGPICADHFDLPWGEDAPKPKRTRKAKAAPVATPVVAGPAPATQVAERCEADDGTPLDDAILWVNGDGETPCTKRYADLYEEQRHLGAHENRYHEIEEALIMLREIGHVGKSVKYDRPDPYMALLARS